MRAVTGSEASSRACATQRSSKGGTGERQELCECGLENRSGVRKRIIVCTNKTRKKHLAMELQARHRLKPPLLQNRAQQPGFSARSSRSSGSSRSGGERSSGGSGGERSSGSGGRGSRALRGRLLRLVRRRPRPWHLLQGCARVALVTQQLLSVFC